MATNAPIKTLPGWLIDRLTHVALSSAPSPPKSLPPRLRTLTRQDLWDALALGWQDVAATRADVLFLCALYPAMGLLLAHFAAGREMLPLVFPLASGFALLGPLAALGLVELSHRREQGLPARWSGMVAVLGAPAIGHIALMAALFLLWLFTAMAIYNNTLGPGGPASAEAFLRNVLSTLPGHALILFGMAAGVLHAQLASSSGFVSFALLPDRQNAAS